MAAPLLPTTVRPHPCHGRSCCSSRMPWVNPICEWPRNEPNAIAGVTSRATMPMAQRVRTAPRSATRRQPTGSFHPALTQTVRLLLNEIERRFFEALHHPPRVDRADAADHARSEIPPDPLNI